MPSAIEAMRLHLLDKPGNPHSSDHAEGWVALDVVDACRAALAAAVNSEADGVVLTSGATEANNLALLGPLPHRGGRNRIIVSAIEHKSVLGPAMHARRLGLEVEVIPVDAQGNVDVEAFVAAIDDRTLVAALMYVNNEVGTAQPVARVGERCREVGALFHVDAVQALRWQPIDIVDIGCSSLSLSAHKIGGPMGIGALVFDPDEMHRYSALAYGGEQEHGLRPGTVPAFLAAGFAASLAELPGTLSVDEWRARTAALLDSLRTLAPELRVNGAGRGRHPGNINVELPGVDASMLIANMQPSVALSQGSACTSGIAEPSHVLTAMGLDSRRCGSSLRISTSPHTDGDEISALIEAFSAALSAM